MWIADLKNGNYRNPILYSDFSDPDVIRVGDDYFMTASSFIYTPGLPILHSKDLVNWKIVNYALEEVPFGEYDMPKHGCGVWAPAIRYHNGEYYIYYGDPDEGIVMVKTKDPFGKWEKPVLVVKSKGWIDTCPFWDDGGQAYLVHGVARSRSGIKSQLFLHKMSSDGKKLLDDGVRVVDGRIQNPTLEGPKMYKRNGYYYIFAPAGGVEHGWQVIFRSKNIYGPYEQKIVLRQGNTPINGPHQGGWVSTQTGEDWFIHFQDIEAYGRIIHMQPVDWVEDWPLMGENRTYDGVGEPVLEYKKPNVGKEYPVMTLDGPDEFGADKLGLQWQWQANYKDGWYSLEQKNSCIRLFAEQKLQNKVNRVYDMPNVLTQMIPMPIFKAVTKVSLKSEENFDQAGFIVTGNTYSYVSLIEENGKKYVQYVNCKGKAGAEEKIIEKKDFSSNEIYFKVDIHNEHHKLEEMICQFYYSIDGENFEKIGSEFKAAPGGWVGAKLGLFAVNFVNTASKGYADFDFLRFEE